jgi:hypothetical protein
LLETIFSELTTDAGLFEAAERSRRVEDVEAVDPNRSSAYIIRDMMSFADIPRPNRGG